MFRHGASGSDPGDAGIIGAGAEFYANFVDLYMPIFIPHVPHIRLSAGSGVPRNFFRGGVQQIRLRTEGRENGDLGVEAP